MTHLEKLNAFYGLPIWTKSSHSESEWRFAQISIGSHSSPNYQLVFEGVKVTNSMIGILGIDDIDLRNGSCPKGSQYDCDFEDYSICSWQQSTLDDFDWELNKGETDSFGKACGI